MHKVYIKKWTTVSEYVDIDTGEVLNKEQVKEQYTIIKKNKKTKLYEQQQHGLITITNECKRRPTQGTFW